MNEFSYTRDDIDELTHRLAQCATELSKQQWDLMLAIFAAAADRVDIGTDTSRGTLPGAQVNVSEGTIENPEEATVKQLREQLRKAHIPGKPPTHNMCRITPPKPIKP